MSHNNQSLQRNNNFPVRRDALVPLGFLNKYGLKHPAKNFASHFTSYIENSLLFRERAARDPGLAEKYEFLKTKIFLGKEY